MKKKNFETSSKTIKSKQQLFEGQNYELVTIYCNIFIYCNCGCDIMWAGFCRLFAYSKGNKNF